MRTGILGGTFDPVHIGHLVLAQECWHRLGLDKVVFVPAYISPFKKESFASPADRLNMLRLAVEGDGRFGISTYEIDKKGTSYTIDTLRMFREEKGACGDGADLFFLTGSDSARGVSEWKNAHEIFKLATFVIANRPGSAPCGQYAGRVERVEIPAVDISSTMVRDRIKERRPIDHIVPREVVRYIRDNGLYRV